MDFVKKEIDLSRFIDKIVNPMMIMDEDEIIQKINSAAKQLFKNHGDDLVGQDIAMLKPESLKSQHDSNLKNYLITEKTNDVVTSRVIQTLSNDNQGILYDLSVTQLVYRGEKKILGIIQDRELDVTQERDVRLAYPNDLEWLVQTIEYAPHPILLSNSKGVLKYLNKKWVQLSGYTLDDVQSLHDWLKKAIPFETPDPNELIQRALYFKNESTSFDYEIITNTGKRRFWNFTINSFNFGSHELKYILLMATDVTEVSIAKKRIEALNQELDEFAQVISHDFKQPIRSIMNFVEIFTNKSLDKFDEQDLHYLKKISDGAQRLIQLNNGLLQLARIPVLENENARISDVVSILDILENLISVIFPKILDDKKALIHFQIDEEYILGFEPQIFRLFQNLISNALKFNKKNIPPIIKITSRKLKNGFLEIRVIDNGIGMDISQIGKIFMIFKRLRTEDEYPGTGIGLAICKKIVQQHGGSIDVISKVNHGSTFIIQLPSIQLDLKPSNFSVANNYVRFEFKDITKVCFFTNDGRLIQSYSVKELYFTPDDLGKESLFSASLMIINNFIQETSNSDEPFYEMRSKDKILIYERGQYLSCCVVAKQSNSYIRNALKLIIFHSEYEFGSNLSNWDGRLNSVNFEPYLNKYFR